MRLSAPHGSLLASGSLKSDTSANHLTELDPGIFPRFEVLDVSVNALSLAQARDFVVQRRYGAPAGYVCFATAHGILEAGKDPELRRAYEQARLCTPDGMPCVWLGRRRGFHNITRVYGPDLMLQVCEAGQALGLKHYFYGGAPGVAETLIRRLRERFPSLQVAGFQSPPYRPLKADEEEAFVAELERTRPDLLWVGLGAPRQEKFMAALSSRLQVGLLLGVGAAFDFHSGRIRQAPRWMQTCGLEWFFRLCQEPRRLGSRYLLGVPRFALALLRRAARERGKF